MGKQNSFVIPFLSVTIVLHAVGGSRVTRPRSRAIKVGVFEMELAGRYDGRGFRTSLLGEGNSGNDVPELPQKWLLPTHLSILQPAKPIKVYDELSNVYMSAREGSVKTTRRWACQQCAKWHPYNISSIFLRLEAKAGWVGKGSLVSSQFEQCRIRFGAESLWGSKISYHPAA